MQYTLHKYKLKTEEVKYSGKIIFSQRINEKVMVERIFKRGSTLTKTDIKAVLMSLTEEIEQCLINGESVTLPFANYKPVIKGVFANDREKYNHNKHTIACSITPGNFLRKLPQSEIRMQRVKTDLPKPQLKQIVDIKTASINGSVTRASMVSITGYQLLFQPEDPQQGIFFIHHNKEFRVAILGSVKAKELIFNVPDTLVPGEYQLEVRALFGKEIRKGIFGSAITVV